MLLRNTKEIFPRLLAKGRRDLEDKPIQKSTARVRLHRQKMKDDGFKSIYLSITPEHKATLQKMCKKMRISQACLISYLLDCAAEGILPNIDEPFSEN